MRGRCVVTGGECSICGRRADGSVTMTRNVERHEGRAPRWVAVPVHRRCLDRLTDYHSGGGHAMAADWAGLLDGDE